jgi:hypothetical protein
MSVANTALLYNLALLAFPVTDDLVSTVAASQSGATVLIGELCRVIKASNTGSFMLKSLLNEEAPPIVFVVNDSANTINIYPAVGETMQGSANAAFQITAGLSAIFVAVSTANLAKSATSVDWRPALIP